MELASQSLALRGSYREIIQRILPVLLAFFIPQINFFVNSAFIAILDREAGGNLYMATAGIVSIYYLVFSVIGIGLSNGVQILIAREAGRDNHAGIRIIFANACFWVLLLSLCFVGLAFCGTPWLLHQVLQADLAELAMEFIQIRILGLPFLYLYLLRNALYINYNKTRALISFSLLETAVNIGLDYSLIFGHYGMPELGFIGAAYASIGAEIIGLIGVALMLYLAPLHSAQRLGYAFRYDAHASRKLARIGGPTVLQMTLSIVSWLVFFFLIAQRGNSFMAASNILRVIFTMVNIFVWATGSVTNAMIGNLYGQARIRDSAKLLRKLLRLGLLGTAILSGLAYLLKSGVFAMLHTNQEMLELAATPYLIILIAFNISIATHICFNALLATHSGMRVIAIELITISLYCAYAYLVCNYLQLSLGWIWSSEILYSLILGGLSGYYFWKYYQNAITNVQS